MSGYRTTSGDPPRIGRPSKICAYQSMASVQNCSLCLSRRQGYRSQETVLISLCNESTRSINVARSGAPKYLAERLIGTVRRECLDRLLICGRVTAAAPQWQKSETFSCPTRAGRQPLRL